MTARRCAAGLAGLVLVSATACMDVTGMRLPDPGERCRLYAAAIAVSEGARADHNGAQARRLDLYRTLWHQHCAGGGAAVAPGG